jgi:DegV family protein with EDD domain
MNPQKIAVLVDSCTDVPQEFIKQHGIYFVPIKIIYRNREYEDNIDITPQEVYDRLETEVPRTSSPEGGSINAAFERIASDGYKKVICINISSALSATYSQMHLLAQDHPALEIRVIDTKSIGMGAGMQAMLATDLIGQGFSFEAVCDRIEASIDQSRIYFCLSTLDYLARGGRIGKISAVLGSLLNIKPIITCNQEGAYVIAAKVRGRAQAIAQTISLAVNEAKKHVGCRIAVIQGNAKEEAVRVMQEVRRLMPQCKEFFVGDVSPALVVHTGPGLIGISVQAIP